MKPNKLGWKANSNVYREVYLSDLRFIISEIIVSNKRLVSWIDDQLHKIRETD